MKFEFTPVTLLSLLLVLVAFFFVNVIWYRRPSRGAAPFAAFILSIVIWTFIRLLVGAAVPPELKGGLAKMMYVFMASAAVWWLIFAVEYAGLKVTRSPRKIILFYLVPLISLALVVTRDWHQIPWLGLAWSLDVSGIFVVWERGFLFWVQMIYLLSLLGAGYIILWLHIIRRPGVFRQQIAFLLAGTLIPVLGMVFYALGRDYLFGVDIIVITLTIGAMIYGLTIFRLRFLDVVPAARQIMVKELPYGIIVLNQSGLVQDINPVAEKLANQNHDRAIGQPLARVWPHLDLIYGNLKQGRNELVLDGRCLDLDLSFFTGRDGEKVGHLIVIRDVTKRRQMEQSLRESETRYATLVEQSNEMVVIIQGGFIRFANNTICRVSGYSHDELNGRPFLSLIVEHDRDMVARRYIERMSGEHVLPTYEFSVRCKNGEIKDLESSMSRIIFSEEEALLATARDITERKLTQRKLATLVEQEKVLRSSLQSEMDKRSKYTRALVHELNTPLTSILASGELMESEVTEKRQSEIVAALRQSSFILKKRIDELIELARGEIGVLKINAMPVDLIRLLKETEAEMRLAAENRGLRFINNTTDGLPMVMGDLERLKQVLRNLITNAIKHTPVGKIELAARMQVDRVEVSVRDTGTGISREDLRTLFDPYRPRSSEQYEYDPENMAIGLTLSKIYVELHGGQLEVESQPGRGSTFRFRLPVYRESDLIRQFSAG